MSGFGPCLCGDPLCPSCGRAQGTYPEPPEPDPDAAYEEARQREIDDGHPWPRPGGCAAPGASWAAPGAKKARVSP